MRLVAIYPTANPMENESESEIERQREGEVWMLHFGAKPTKSHETPKRDAR